MNGYHRGIVALEDSHIIQGIFAASKIRISHYLHQRAAFHCIISRIQRLQAISEIIRTYIRQEPQSAHVHTDDGYRLVAHPADCLQECAVATHGYDKVGIKVVVAEHTIDIQLYLILFNKKVIIFTVDADVSTIIVKATDDVFYRHRLLRLIRISEYCKL